MLVHEITRHNSHATVKRYRELESLYRKHRRSDLMRLRRSELGKRIFSKEQRRVLDLVFKGWVRYWMWHLGHKEAFELKYTVIKQGMDLRRLHPKILGAVLPNRPPRDDDIEPLDEEHFPPLPVNKHAPKSPDSGGTTARPSDDSDSDDLGGGVVDDSDGDDGDDGDAVLAAIGGAIASKEKKPRRRREDGDDDEEELVCPPVGAGLGIGVDRKEDARLRLAAERKRLPELEVPPRLPFPKTHAQRLRSRVIVCKQCGSSYTEAHNRPDICTYHPGEYRLSCPRSCPAFLDKSKMTNSCMAHRRNRWSCCDKPQRGDKGSTGCQRRFHAAPDAAPEYANVAKQLTDEYGQQSAALDVQLKKISENDVMRQATAINKDQLDVIGNAMDKERGIVHKYTTLNCAAYMETDTIVEVLQEFREKRKQEAIEQQQAASKSTQNNPSRRSLLM